MTTRLKLWLPLALVLLVALAGLLLAGAPQGGTADPSATAPASTVSPLARQSTATRTVGAPAAVVRRDLSVDEAAGGHTLERHVGRTDAELRQRLRDEPDISAASTYSDRDTAERVVGLALRHYQSRIADWVDQGRSRPNLALDFEAGEVIGRSIPRGRTTAHDVTSATIVLRADGQSWYVLTSYPDD